MQTIGERLEEARKRKGISIREAAETTKIRGDYLQKFEANTFDIDLPPLYIRGFVRTYSRFLELDPERLISEVDALLARHGGLVRGHCRPHPRRARYRAVRGGVVSDQAGRDSLGRVLINPAKSAIGQEADARVRPEADSAAARGSPAPFHLRRSRSALGPGG